MKVILKRRDDGKLYCQVYREIKDKEKQDRLERSLGKFFFPDKSWTDVCPGEAEVEITKEFENYGFIKGHMDDYTCTDFGAILDYLWNNGNCYPVDLEFSFFKNAHGEFLVHRDEFNAICRIGHTPDYLKPMTEELFASLRFCSNDEEQDIVEGKDKIWTKTLQDMFLEYAWYGDLAADRPSISEALLDEFVVSKNQFNLGRRQGWAPSSKYFGDDLVEWAYQNGVIDIWEIPGMKIYAVTIRINDLYRLQELDGIEEAEHLISTLNEINRKADEEVAAKIRKGKLAM